MTRQKRVAFDLDDVICTRKSEEGGVLKYHTCVPIPEGVALVNQCYDAGYDVTIYTARGMVSCDGDLERIDRTIRPLTEKHLREWGVRYHQLIMGKFPYDLLVCDKAVDSRVISTLADVEYHLSKELPGRAQELARKHGDLTREQRAQLEDLYWDEFSDILDAHPIGMPGMKR